MIVTEPSAVSKEAIGFLDAPQLITDNDVRSWRTVTNALHEKGCTVVCQLWHTGRMSHSSFHSGDQILGPSPIAIGELAGEMRDSVPSCGVQGADGMWHEHERPRAMSTSEAEVVIAAFGNAATLAKAAGFDGIEIHAASGYLIDTFLQACSNVRDDKYGGNSEGRFTFLAEVLQAVSASFPLSRVGVKISPNNGFNGMGSAETKPTFLHAAAQLDKMGVGYLHVVDGVGHTRSVSWYGRIESNGFHGFGSPISLSELRSVFTSGALIGNGGYDADMASAAIVEREADAISFGRVYMSNPDLVERLRDGLPLAPLPSKESWFEPTSATRANPAKGYSDFGPYAEAPIAAKKATVLHLTGSPTSTYYAELSLMYARGCASANDDGEYHFVYCVVHPGSLMSIPTDLSPETLASTPRMPVAEAIGNLARLGADVCQSHMFCAVGVSTYRALLDLLHIPFVGGSVDAMCLTMHKAHTRAVVMEAGVPCAQGEVLRRGMRPTLNPPYILKPCSEDNSMGLGVVRHESEMEVKLADAFTFDDEVLCERFIPPGREIRFAVLESESGQPSITLPAVEYFLTAEKPVRTSNDKTHVDENGRPLKFAKPNRACPADIDDALHAKLVDAVTKAHAALGCRDYSLYDFRVDPEGNIFFLEASLFCCFAPNSVICLMADATGQPELKPRQLFKTMIKRALSRKSDPAVTATSGQLLGSKPKTLRDKEPSVVEMPSSPVRAA